MIHNTHTNSKSFEDGPRSIPQRYKICGDNSGHDYFIKVEEVEAFYKWAEDDDPEDPGKYDEFRIDGRFTFADPRCD